MNFGLINQVKLPLNVQACGITAVDNNHNVNYNKN